MSNNSVHSQSGAPTHGHFAAACDAFKARHNISELAHTIGMSVHVLHNKFNPACTAHQLTWRNLIDLYHASGDDILLDGLMFECGLTAVQLPSPADVIAPEARAQQALNAGAHILGVTAQATTALAAGRVTKGSRNTVVGGLWVGIEHLVVLATEVEDRFHAEPSAPSAALGV
ncbi:MAG: phage regulatory CII family protein [Aeromonas sp.]